MRIGWILLVALLAACQATPEPTTKPSESASPSPGLLARGNFTTGVREVVELEATQEGAGVAVGPLWSSYRLAPIDPGGLFDFMGCI